MDINRLNEFITLATLLNYSKAANQLYLTQPALSRHIHDLEQTLGTQLFIRDTHNVHLTSVGEIFLKEAQEIITRYNHALDLIKEVSSTSTGELKIGFLGTASQSFLSDFVMGFTASHPQIKLSMTSDALDILVKQLNDGFTDLAFVTHVDKNYLIGLESKTIMKSPLIAVMHPTHALANRDSLSIKDLSGFPMINFSPQANPITSDFNKQIFKKAGAQLNALDGRDGEFPNIETAAFCASINEGMFIMPEYLRSSVGSLKTIPLSDPFAYVTLNLIWKKKNPNISIPVFVDSFSTYIQNRNPNLTPDD